MDIFTAVCRALGVRDPNADGNEDGDNTGGASSSSSSDNRVKADVEQLRADVAAQSLKFDSLNENLNARFEKMDTMIEVFDSIKVALNTQQQSRPEDLEKVAQEVAKDDKIACLEAKVDCWKVR